MLPNGLSRSMSPYSGAFSHDVAALRAHWSRCALQSTDGAEVPSMLESILVRKPIATTATSAWPQASSSTTVLVGPCSPARFVAWAVTVMLPWEGYRSAVENVTV